MSLAEDFIRDGPAQRRASTSDWMNELAVNPQPAKREGFRIRLIMLWAIAGAVVLIGHAACALVLLDWPVAAPSEDEPPAAILIDMPATTPGTVPLVHASRGLGDNIAREPFATPSPAVEFSTPTDSLAATSVGPSFAMATMPQSLAAPSTMRPPKRKRELEAQKPQRTVRKVRKAPPKQAVRRMPVIAPTAIADAAAAPAARRVVASTGAALTAADIPSTWKSELLAQLERYKRYPDAARAERAEGTTLLSFTIDRDGHVLDSFVARSSGFPPLDDETLAMLQRASPLPKIPGDVPGESLQLVVPVHFSVQ